MRIRQDDLRGPEIAALLEAHLENSRRWSPPESIHALDLDALRTRDITFWTLWKGGELIACGALGALAADAGEIKSMHTAEKHRGRGASAAMLRHIIAEARRRDDRAGMLCGALATPSARAPSLNGRVRDRQYDLPPKACAALSRQPQPCFADQAAMRWTLMA